MPHLDGGFQIHAKVDHLPLDALADVLLLLQNEHMVVEELLQLLIAEVDAENQTATFSTVPEWTPLLQERLKLTRSVRTC